MKRMKTLLPAALLTTALLSGCAVGPDYQRPTAATSAAFKEAEGWVAAKPADAIPRDRWWAVFNDPLLDELAPKVALSNQNVAAAVASYAQARALVGQQRALLLPAVNLTAGGNRTNIATAVTPTQRVRVDLGASWEADVWGRLRRTVESASANAEASAADLATATLSAQAELVANYLLLRQADAQRLLLERAITDYERVVTITENRYRAGIAAKTDLLQAQTQLANARSDHAGLGSQRAQLEHAIAVLLGEAPANFAIVRRDDWSVRMPEVPLLLPSELLQRRPDIAAAERRVAAANAQIGIARSAYFPSITLSGSTGAFDTSFAGLLASPTTVWSVGFALTQSVFNAGLVSSRVRGAEAGYDAEVAHYRQTVLSALQGVEDQLSATRVLAMQEKLLTEAADASAQAQQQMLNRYRAGQVSFLDVVVTQTSALNAKRALQQVQANRQVAAVALIQGLGGGWSH